MQREIPTWLAAIVIAVVVLVAAGLYLYFLGRRPPTAPVELIKNPPNPTFTARPGIPPMQKSPNPTTP